MIKKYYEVQDNFISAPLEVKKFLYDSLGNIINNIHLKFEMVNDGFYEGEDKDKIIKNYSKVKDMCGVLLNMNGDEIFNHIKFHNINLGTRNNIEKLFLITGIEIIN